MNTYFSTVNTNLGPFLSLFVAMMLYWMILFVNTIASIRVGRLENCTYAPRNDSAFVFNATTCQACFCNAWLLHSPSFIAMNCFDNGMKCQLFYNYSTSYTMSTNRNSTFFFYPQLPQLMTTSVPITYPLTNAASTISMTQTSLITVHTTVSTTTAGRITTAASVLRWNSTGSTVAGDAAGSSGVSTNRLYYPYSLLLDSNNSLLITDYHSNRIQKWPMGAVNGTTVAGRSDGVSGSASPALSMPVGMVLDSNGNMYLTDRGNHRVMFWANGASSGTTIAGITGSSGSANNQFNSPSALVRNSSSGTLYIADTFNHRIMRYLTNASSGTVVAGGNGPGVGRTQLNDPYCFVFDSTTNSFLIVNYSAHTIVRWILGASNWTLVAGIAGSSGNTATTLNAPLSIVLDPMGNMYIADSNNHRIQLFLAGQSNGTTIAGVTGSSGTALNKLNCPYWAILDHDLNLYVADTFNNRVQKFRRY